MKPDIRSVPIKTKEKCFCCEERRSTRQPMLPGPKPPVCKKCDTFMACFDYNPKLIARAIAYATGKPMPPL